MNRKLYLSNGYLNMEYIYNIPVPFIFIVGGRGIGKTYGAIKYCTEQDKKFILMRRTQMQSDLISIPDLSPLKPVFADAGMQYKQIPFSRQCRAFYYLNGEEIGDFICYTIALSTFSNMRGFNADNIEVLLYDEFIPEPHERPIKNEGKAFLNCYETINRNRELQGRPPVKVICMANAFELGNALFNELSLVNKAEQMSKHGQQLSVNEKRGYAIIMPKFSTISEEKANSVLYKLTGTDSDYSKMALLNDFVDNTGDFLNSRSLEEYKLAVNYGAMYIYRHKAKDEYYVSEHCTGTPRTSYDDTESNRRRFRKHFAWLWQKYLNNKVVFENYSMRSNFVSIFD